VKLGEEWEVKVKVKHSLCRANTVPEGSRVLRLSMQSAHGSGNMEIRNVKMNTQIPNCKESYRWICNISV
jgi:hypothetical protein